MIPLHGQTYSLQELETRFLTNNLQLIAAKFQVNKVDALIIQEKLWPNPTLNIDNINLWSNESFERMPNLIGNYGSRQQINIDLEQLIETAGKRKKRIAIRTLEKNAAHLEFEEIIRQLKFDLRSNFYSLCRIQLQETQLKEMLELFKQLDKQYKIQADKKNISQVNYYRIHMELRGIQNELIDLEGEKLEKIKYLRILCTLPQLLPEQLEINKSFDISFKVLPFALKDDILRDNISLKSLHNEINISEQQYVLEKAQQIPNLNMLINYERGGNVMNNFIGFGLGIDLPLFNRNKGNIQAAKLQIEQNQKVLRLRKDELMNELDRLVSLLNLYENHIKQWREDSGIIQNEILDNYAKHLEDKQITLLEFIDFSQSYREAKKILFAVKENYLNTYEHLQYLVGKDL